VIRRETTHPFSVVSNPEFLKQGAAIDDFMKPDRVVIGAEDPRARADARAVRAVHAHRRADHGDGLRQRRAGKYAANAMLATRISFMNEVANVCERSAPTSIRCAGASARTPHRHVVPVPGVGYGGSCFPKDVKAMMRFARSRVRLPILRRSRRST
jgi:UDPglucose 6-dehydrogenase